MSQGFISLHQFIFFINQWLWYSDYALHNTIFVSSKVYTPMLLLDNIHVCFIPGAILADNKWQQISKYEIKKIIDGQKIMYLLLFLL